MTDVCRTLRLTEHHARTMRLRRAEADELLSAGPAIEVVPTRDRGRYRVTARGVAGLLLTPTLRVVIRPKLPAANLFLLLDPDAPPGTVADRSTPEPGTEAIDFLARRLAERMRARAAVGLPHGYVERSDRQTFLTGRLDVAAQARESPAARDRFHVTRDEFSPDTAVHRLTKATAELLTSSPFVSAPARRAVAAALAEYTAVASVPVDPLAFDRLSLDRPPESERELIDLCRLLVGALRPGGQTGAVFGPAFLLDLDRVWERYVERGLRPVRGVEVQREFCYHVPVPAGQPPLVGRPDFVIRRAGRPVCAIDAKWKALDGSPPAADVHQALAYAAGLCCPDVRLVYPGRRSAEWRYELTASDVRLTVHTLRVIGPRERCEWSVRRVVRSLPE